MTASRYALAAILPFLVSVPCAQAADPPPLSNEEQRAVNQAIERGAWSLRAGQNPWGTWSVDKGPAEADRGPHWVGRTALAGLTLLECGVPADDRGILAAAQRVRESREKLAETYDLALAVLFLDRLGNPKDEGLIELFSLRLIAGQTPSGGWSYRCPVLNPLTHKQLLTVLRQMPPAGDARCSPPGTSSLTASGKPPAASDAIVTSGDYPSYNTGSPGPSGSGSPAPGNSGPSPSGSRTTTPAPVVKIPPNLANLPVLLDPKQLEKWTDPKDKTQELLTGTTDNSNSQFAILALWAARRHDLPMDRTLYLMAQRYRLTQNADGGWGYHQIAATAPPMTAVGLLGLAVGVGLAEDRTPPDTIGWVPRRGQCIRAGEGAAPEPPAVVPWTPPRAGMCIRDAEGPMPDPAPRKAGPRAGDADQARVLKGLTTLSGFIGKPIGRMQNVTPGNLYFLWSVERVGVLYNLHAIGDKDWYRWGAEILVANQSENGAWSLEGGYPGQDALANTCLALLFLKRANLVSDLSNKLPFDPQQVNKVIAERTAPPPEPAPPPPSPAQVASPAPPPPALVAARDELPPPPKVAEPEPRTNWLWLLLLIPLLILAASVSMFVWYWRQQKQEAAPEERPRKQRPKAEPAPHRKRSATRSNK